MVARRSGPSADDGARGHRTLGGRTLLTLDTVTGGAAEPLYLSLGYVSAGVIPRYARGALTPDLEATTIMYKELRR